MSRPGGVHPLTALWAVLLLGPFVVLSHFACLPMGPNNGCHTATLDPAGYLYGWTLHRLTAWAVLYLAGAGLLWLALQRDRDGGKYAALASAWIGRSLVPFSVVLCLVLLAFLPAADVVLLWMLLLVLFFALWALSRSAPAFVANAARATLLLATLLVTLGCAEAVMRLPAVVRHTGGSLVMRTELFKATHRVFNADGSFTRSRHAFAPKLADSTRILAIGDSFTWGEWVADPDAVWPNVLETELARTGRAVQVLNMSAGATDTPKEAHWLRTFGPRLEPDIVILQFTLNDTGYTPFDDVGSLLPLFGSSLAQTSALYCRIDFMYRSSVVTMRPEASWNLAFRADREGWRSSQTLLKEMRADVEARGGRFAILLFPMFDSPLDAEHYRSLEAHRAIAEFAAAAGIPLLDLRERLAAIDSNPRAWWAQPFDAHPNAAAQAVAAQAVASWLRELSWL